MSYVDIFILAIMLLFGLIGLAKGFFKSLKSLLGFAICFFGAFFLAKPIFFALMNIEPLRNITLGGKGLYSWILKLIPSELKSVPASDIASLNYNGMWTAFLYSCKDAVIAVSPSNISVGQAVALCATQNISSVIIMIIIFALFRVVFFILALFFKALFNKKPDFFSRILGAVLGAARGFGYAILLLFIFSFFSGASFVKVINEEIDKSFMAKSVYSVIVDVKDKTFNIDEDSFVKLLDYSKLHC